MLFLAQSFNIDLTGLLSAAANFFNGIFPVFVPILGLILGFGIVQMVVRFIKSALGGG